MNRKIISPQQDQRIAILESVGLKSDEPLLIAVEAMVNQAHSERPAHPQWGRLSARNFEGIAAAREALERHGGWHGATSKKGLAGVRHVESGRFLAIHNTCVRTGLDKDLPRFASERTRTATKSLRDDLQGELFDDKDISPDGAIPADNHTLHLCVFIKPNPLDTGQEELTTRAELLIGATCTNQGFTDCTYRLPLDLEGVMKRPTGDAAPGEGEAVEADVSIREKW